MFVGIGLVATWAHGGVERFQVGAEFGVDPAGKVAHAVGALPGKIQSTAATTVVLVEQAVGVEVVGDAPADVCDEIGVLTLRVAHQDSFGYLLLVLRYGRGQHVECFADSGDVIVADLAGLDGGGQLAVVRVAAGDRSGCGGGGFGR